MNSRFERYGLYKIDMDYLQFLHTQDSQVFYQNVEAYSRKPYLGLLTRIASMDYCIPLTSAKPRHINWANVSNGNMLVYDIVEENEIGSQDIYKVLGDGTYKKIFSVLEIRKMIPVNENVCSYINFQEIEDLEYRRLLEKEYAFLKSNKHTILNKATRLYKKQKETGIIDICCCNFEILEAAYNNYIQEHF